jgi:type I restriction enzyme S subunit
MSRIDELLAELCPRGVEFKPLDEVLDYEQPGRYLVASTAYDDAFSTPVLTAGQTFVLGFTDELNGIYPAAADRPVIIFDDFTTAFKWVDFPFKAKSSAMKMLTPKADAQIEFRFIYYVMQTIRYRPQDHARQWIGTYSGFIVPIPPLPVQREIVRILDKFTQLEAELETELKARRRQYEHYRNSLVAFHGNESIRRVALRELCEFRRGTAITATAAKPGDVPVVANGPTPSYSHSLSNREGKTIVVARSGAYAGLVSFWEEPIFLTDAFSVHPNEQVLAPRYVFYVLQSQQAFLHDLKKGAGVPHVRVKEVEALEIPVPTLAEQALIAEALDNFYALVNDLSIGLPAELAARRSQYEYYRDRLMSFEVVAV